MKKMIALVALCLVGLSNVAFAADATCAARATEKKLAGAAKNSFMKKCEKDAAAGTTAPASGSACQTKAAEKKLAGAAKNSFVKKCEKDMAAPAAASGAKK